MSKDGRGTLQSYQYICYQNLADQADGKQEVIKIPQISKKDMDSFKHSKFEQVGV
jgi:hypothetical protein